MYIEIDLHSPSLFQNLRDHVPVMFIIFPPSYPGGVDRNQGQSAPMKYSECSDVMNIGEMWKIMKSWKIQHFIIWSS